MHKQFYSNHWFLKNQIFSLFPIVKMNTIYAEICRVGNLDADFQQAALVQFFCKFHNIVVKSIIQILQRNMKTIVLIKNSKKSLCYKNCMGYTNFLP